MSKTKKPVLPVSNFVRLAPRNRVGKRFEDSHEFPHLTEPNLVSPLDKILAARNQGLPVHFNAGKYLEEDFSILDGMDAFQLFEFRQNIESDIEERKKEFHAATKLLAEREKEAAQAAKKDEVEPKSTETTKVDSTASNEAKN